MQTTFFNPRLKQDVVYVYDLKAMSQVNSNAAYLSFSEAAVSALSSVSRIEIRGMLKKLGYTFSPAFCLYEQPAPIPRLSSPATHGQRLQAPAAYGRVRFYA